MFLARQIAPRGFEPLNENQQPVGNKRLTENDNPVLSIGLDKLLQKHPDLVSLIEHWTDIPEPTRKQIIAKAWTAINSLGGPKK